ncbi:Dehydrodolichyl diphosphate syntase complex subunit nus1, partial [Thalictrum thalictroides]
MLRVLRLVWLFLHLVAKIWYFVVGAIHTVHSYLISSGLFNENKALDLTKLQYLAIVVESQEAYDTARVVKLLCWLSNIGVKYVCLYDMDGVLKKSKKIILEELGDSRLWHLEGEEMSSCMDPMHMTLEFISFSDGKEGVARAASFLCTKYLEDSDFEEKDKPFFTEANMGKALTAVGCGGPQPNLLLVYGPVRCHLGFPAWRMRYTEI